MSALQGCVTKFRAADIEGKETIIQDIVGQLEGSWNHDLELNRDLLEKVSPLSAMLFYPLTHSKVCPQMSGKLVQMQLKSSQSIQNVDIY
jgi:hypothetical protein